MNREDLSIGQKVVLHDINHRKGTPYPEGTVVKIGRVRVTVQGPYGNPEQYNIEDQSLCSDRHPGAWFRTYPQEEQAVQRERDVEVLRRYGFREIRPMTPNDLVHRVAEFLLTTDTCEICGTTDGTHTEEECYK